MSAQERRVYLALALGFLALIAASVTSFLAVRDLALQSTWVDHSYQVRLQLEFLLSTHQDTQTGARGYVITGNRNYLQPYAHARERANDILKSLAAMVQDNPAQSARLRALEGIHRQHFELAEQIVKARQQRGAETAGQIITSGVDKRLMDALRDAVAKMDAQEATLLAERAENERRAVTRLNWTLLASSLFALLVVAFGGSVIHRDFGRRRRAETTIREQNTLLESRVQERTTQLRDSEARLCLLIEGVKDYAIVMLDPQGKIITWNDGAQRLNGYAQAEILGQPMERLYSPEDVATGKPENSLKLAVAASRCEDEGWRLRKDGTRFYANVILTTMRDSSGALIGFAMITRDITERMHAMERIQRHAEEQRAANEELTRFNRSMVDRELRMIELKEEINDLCIQLGQPARYPSAVERVGA